MTNEPKFVRSDYLRRTLSVDRPFFFSPISLYRYKITTQQDVILSLCSLGNFLFDFYLILGIKDSD